VIVPHKRACAICARPFQSAADGKLRAHVIDTPNGKRRCTGGKIPPSDYLARVSWEDLRAIDEKRHERAELDTYDPIDREGEGGATCAGCGHPSMDCRCHRAW
jgi:hypothetical protein